MLNYKSICNGNIPPTSPSPQGILFVQIIEVSGREQPEDEREGEECERRGDRREERGEQGVSKEGERDEKGQKG